MQINQLSQVVRKYMVELLRERYAPNERTIARIAHATVVTEQDVKDFVQLVVDAYDVGYTAAVNDYRDKMKEIGYDVIIRKKDERRKEHK